MLSFRLNIIFYITFIIVYVTFKTLYILYLEYITYSCNTYFYKKHMRIRSKSYAAK